MLERLFLERGQVVPVDSQMLVRPREGLFPSVLWPAAGYRQKQT